MTESPLAKKLRLKPGMRAVLVNAPADYAACLRPLPEGVVLSRQLRGSFDWIQAFVKDKAELGKLTPRLVKALRPEGMLWVSFPKGSSGIQTDLTRDKGWEDLSRAELKWITLVSVDAVWSAFALRPFRPGEPRASSISRRRS